MWRSEAGLRVDVRAASPGRIGRNGERVGRLSALMAGATSRLRRADRPVDGPDAAAVAASWAWAETEGSTEDWYPQGITGSHEPGAIGPDGASARSDGEHLVVSWYAHGSPSRRGARITVVETETGRYRHVLLVRTRWWWPGTLAPVATHAGGLAWVGPYLYVAATGSGVLVFRWDHLRAVPPGTAGAADRADVAHVLVLCGRLRAVGRHEEGRLRTSFLSLQADDEGRFLVCGEYGRRGQSQRLWRFRLDPRTHLPVTGAGRVARPDRIHTDQPARMQGAVVADGTWAVSTSQGRGNRGDLVVGAPGSWRRYDGVLPTGPEDLSLAGDGTLWSLTEWPGERWILRLETPRDEPPRLEPPRDDVSPRPRPASDAAPS